MITDDWFKCDKKFRENYSNEFGGVSITRSAVKFVLISREKYGLFLMH